MTGHLVVVLPGGNAGPYTAPLLIPSLALEQLGAIVRVADYPDFRPNGLGREDSAAFDAFVLKEVQRLVDGAEWHRITFVAKSRGTLFLSIMPPLDTAATVEAIWVTPLLGFDYVQNGLVEKRWRSLIVGGSADPYHEASTHDATCAAIHADSLVVDGADHGLVVRGDVRRTVKGYADLADATLAFAQQ